MLNRHDSRVAVLGLVFESEYNCDDLQQMYENALVSRDIEENEYIKTVFFGIIENAEKLDAYIEKYSKGRKLSRIAKVAKSIMRIAIYEMLYIDSIPSSVSINEAIELIKLYDDEKTKGFVNGVLNSVKEELES